MDKLVEIKSSLENLWSDLKDESSETICKEKKFEYVGTLCLEPLMIYESIFLINVKILRKFYKF